MTYSFAPNITQPLLDLISHNSVPYHMFVGDTELYKSDSSFEAFTFARIIESCISGVKVWVVRDKLRLKEDKTEIPLIGSAPEIDLPSSLHVGHSDIQFSNAACNLGVIFYSQLALRNRWTNSVNLLTWSSGGSVQFGRHFLSRSSKPIFCFVLANVLSLIHIWRCRRWP